MSGAGSVFGRLRRLAASVYRRVRRLGERVLHRSRHRTALSRLTGVRRTRSVLVVCHGNICRSPYFEALLRRDLSGVEVSSAGFVGPGQGVPAHSLTVAARKGLDLSRHRSRIVTRPILATADLIVVMEARQARALIRGFGMPASTIIVAGDLDPGPIPGRSILDPWGKPLEFFEASFARLDRCARVLVRAFGGV